MAKLKNGLPRAKKGEGSFRKTPTGKFEYRIKYTDTYGQKRAKSFTSQTVDECLEKAEEFLKRVAKLSRGVD